MNLCSHISHSSNNGGTSLHLRCNPDHWQPAVSLAPKYSLLGICLVSSNCLAPFPLVACTMSALYGPWVSTGNRSRSRSRSRIPAQVERMPPPPLPPPLRFSSLQPSSPSPSPPPPLIDESELSLQSHSYDPPPPITDLDREPFGNPPG
jgi:hypothetical protein